ncbi:MAG: SDR family oxidoreductase [Anaerolineales bacterium]|jgi:3-oxoacyl-[acyl-carrier protein] reductase
MDLRLQGKRALVAGASRGLGYALAQGLAREGADLVINSRDPEGINAAAQKLAGETKVQVTPLPGDVANPAIPDKLIEGVVAALGGLDLLVTNSGGPPSGKFETFDDETWQYAVNLNLLSHVRLIRAALPYLRQSEAASVLTITSYSVKQPIPNLVLSNSVRAATVGLTKTLALELGSDGIRFNSILPAWTETERVHELMEYRAKANGTSLEEEFSKQTQDSPFGRMGKPEEFANAGVFLLSPAASYITGVMLTVDGGMYKGTL